MVLDDIQEGVGSNTMGFKEEIMTWLGIEDGGIDAEGK